MQNSIINVIKCYFEYTLGKPREYYHIARLKRSKDQPKVLSAQEVKANLNQPTNIKHRAILHTIYGAGFQMGELTRLRGKDIPSEEGYLFIKNSKGKKDRRSVWSIHLVRLLRA